MAFHRKGPWRTHLFRRMSSKRILSATSRVVDPTKVVRIALENAVSVASVLLLTEATMTEIPVEKKPMPEMQT